MFTHGNIILQVLLVNSAKRSEKVSQRDPQAFNSVDVNFSDAIAVIVARPLFLTMTDHPVTTRQLGVALPLIAVTGRGAVGEPLNMPVQCLFVGALFYSKATLAAAPSDSSDDGRTVILICAMTALLVCAPTWRISLVLMAFSFFPQRSETSHLFQSDDLSKESLQASCIRFLAIADAMYARSDARCQALQLRPENFRLCIHRARAKPLVAVLNCCPQRLCCDTS